MKKYFYSDGKEKKGPFSFEELKNEEINLNTLIWFEGLENWTKAKYILELEEILQLSPPPIPGNEIKTNITDNKTYEKVEDSLTNHETTKSFRPKRNGMFSRPFSFEGRIRRTEYGISIIIYALLVSMINVIWETNEEAAILGLGFLPILWFIFAQGAKRCHDMGQSGWWQLIPFYPLWMIFAKGKGGISNKYGVNPKI